MLQLNMLINAPPVRDNLFLGLLLLAFAFSSFRGSDTNTLLAAIFMGGVAWVGYTYLADQSAALQKTQANVRGALESEAQWLKGKVASTYSDQMWLPTFPKKGFVFLASNPILVEIATALSVMRMFDRSRYADLCHLLNTYQKIYEYILSDRYDASSHLSIFQDAGDAVLDVMRSAVFVVPPKFQHVYGVDYESRVQANVDRFTVLRRKMTRVLESYAKKELGVHVVPESLPKPSSYA
jgi:hypothetical protein